MHRIGKLYMGTVCFYIILSSWRWISGVIYHDFLPSVKTWFSWYMPLSYLLYLKCILFILCTLKTIRRRQIFHWFRKLSSQSGKMLKTDFNLFGRHESLIKTGMFTPSTCPLLIHIWTCHVYLQGIISVAIRHCLLSVKGTMSRLWRWTLWRLSLEGCLVEITLWPSETRSDPPNSASTYWTSPDTKTLLGNMLLQPGNHLRRNE